MFASRMLITLVVAFAVLLVESGLASADENDVEAASPVLLEPGYNFVGWIAEAIAVADLFEAVPEIEVVVFWDAEERDWRWAAPRVPERFWTLDAVDPGMAVLVWNASEGSVPWMVQTEPALGLVELHQGTNWVSWAGPSGWSVDDAARGIGGSLVRVNVGSHAYDPAQNPEEPSMRRGAPMVVEVARDVPWLQPTGSLPKVSFFGDFPEARQQYYTDIVREVVEYFGTGYGVEADPTTLEIWIFDEDALDSADLSSEAREVLAFHAERNIATGSAERIVYPASSLPARIDRPRASSVMLHEYFHAMQQQISGFNFGSAPIWIVEGQAVWMEFKHDFTGPANPWAYYTEREAGGCGYATLQAAERTAFGCEYTLGVLATKLLDELVGAEAMVEFWRQLAPQAIGPHGQWDAASRWEEAFGRAIGFSPDEFYGRFGEQRSTPTPTDSGPTGTTTFVEGRVQDAEGGGVAGVRVALTQSSGLYVGYVSNAVTNAEGDFVAEVFAGESQRIQVVPLDGCGYWIAESGATLSRELGREFTFDNSSQTPLNLRLHAEVCGKVEGTVESPEFGPLAGVQVWIAVGGDEWYPGQRTRGDGSSTLSVPREKPYRIGVNLSGDCSVFYRQGEPAGAWHEATAVRLSDSDVTGIHVEIPSDACVLP